MTQQEVSRVFDIPRTSEPNYDNAQNCQSSQKIMGESVYCQHLDQYISIRYCQNLCLNFKNKHKPKQEIQPLNINSVMDIDEEEPSEATF